MLILLLEPGEKNSEVFIGEDITLRVLDIYKDTNQVRLGIDAPKEMLIDRKSVRKLREQRIKSVFDKHTV